MIFDGVTPARKEWAQDVIRCSRKLKFNTRRDAVRKAYRMAASHHWGSAHPYKCKVCGYYHLTTRAAFCNEMR